MLGSTGGSRDPQLNRDLVWTLGGNRYPEATFGFLKRFESALCLFSGTVSQLYSNYEIVQFGHDNSRLLALPNAYAAHDTFSNIEAAAVEPTGLFIIPSEITDSPDEKTLQLLYRCGRTGKPKTVPLSDGLEKVKQKYLPQEPFLPVMINRDLKSLKGSMPAMHLHRLRVSKLEGISELMKGDISKTVQAKMSAFYSV